MALCSYGISPANWLSQDAVAVDFRLPISPYLSWVGRPLPTWSAGLVFARVDGLVACPVGTVEVVVTTSEWDALRELSVINQTLKDELAATRTAVISTGALGNQTVQAESIALQAKALSLQSQAERISGEMFVAALGFALFAGLFFGWKALGRGAGRSG